MGDLKVGWDLKINRSGRHHGFEKKIIRQRALLMEITEVAELEKERKTYVNLKVEERFMGF